MVWVRSLHPVVMMRNWKVRVKVVDLSLLTLNQVKPPAADFNAPDITPTKSADSDEDDALSYFQKLAEE